MHGSDRNNRFHEPSCQRPAPPAEPSITIPRCTSRQPHFRARNLDRLALPGAPCNDSKPRWHQWRRRSWPRNRAPKPPRCRPNFRRSLDFRACLPAEAEQNTTSPPPLESSRSPAAASDRATPTSWHHLQATTNKTLLRLAHPQGLPSNFEVQLLPSIAQLTHPPQTKLRRP